MTLLAPPGCTRKPSGSGLSASSRGNSPASASSRTVAASRSGREKMLRTANISSVPTRCCRVSGNTLARAFWCIMWKAIIATSHTPSRQARCTISCGGIARRGLGDAEMAEFALLLLAQQRRRDAPRAAWS